MKRQEKKQNRNILIYKQKIEFKKEHYLLLEVVKQCQLSAKTNLLKPVSTVPKKMELKSGNKIKLGTEIMIMINSKTIEI